MTFSFDDSPVYDLPGVGEVGDDLHGDEDLLLYVDDADHLVQVLAGVGQELFDLQIGLQLVELLDLEKEKRQIFLISI